MSSSGDARQILVLDFDGVLCDSLVECMLVAYLAHESLPLQSFVDPGPAGLPIAVTERIRRCRPFMRHLGHFIVPLRNPQVARNQADFATQFARVPVAEVDAFVNAAVSLRQAIRTTFEAQWIAHHHVDARLVSLVADAFIATARDANSVSRILQWHGINTDRTRIFGSLRDKVPALKAIAAMEAVDPGAVVLVDDNIENCLAATAAGYSAQWASWGYHLPGDVYTARSHGVPVLAIADLSAGVLSRADLR